MRVACLVVCALLVGCGKAERAPEAPPGEARYTPVEADDLGREWKRNPAAAAEKYQGEGVELSGTLHEVGANASGQTFIRVHGASGDRDLAAHVFVLDARAKEGLKKCAVGQPVVVKARSEGSTRDRPWLVADEVAPGGAR